MYKKLLVLAALMSAVCFTAVAHETLNTQGSYYVAEAKSWKVTIKGQIKKKGTKSLLTRSILSVILQETLSVRLKQTQKLPSG